MSFERCNKRGYNPIGWMVKYHYCVKPKGHEGNHEGAYEYWTGGDTGTFSWPNKVKVRKRE